MTQTKLFSDQYLIKFLEFNKIVLSVCMKKYTLSKRTNNFIKTRLNTTLFY